MSECNVINVSEISAETIRNPGKQKAILAMQATKAFVDGDEKQFRKLNAILIDVVVDRVPPTMTYQDVIFENDDPYGNTYVLSDDLEVAQAEAGFYRAHQSIEVSLERAVSRLAISALFGLAGSNRARFIRPVGDTRAHFAERQRGSIIRYVQPKAGSPQLALLRSVPQSLMDRDLSQESLDVTGCVQEATGTIVDLFRDLNPEHFSAFRPYFVGLNNYPGRYPGPSGLFTAAVPILDLLVHNGRNTSQAERDRIGRNLEDGLYPLGKGNIVGAHLLRALLSLESAELDINPQKREIEDQLDRFRSAHMAIVKRNIPGAMEGRTGGSGGVTDVRSYLRSKKIRGLASGEMR